MTLRHLCRKRKLPHGIGTMTMHKVIVQLLQILVAIMRQFICFTINYNN